MTVKALGVQMDSAEMIEWQAFFQVNGWLQERLAKGESPSQAMEYAQAMHRILTRTGK